MKKEAEVFKEMRGFPKVGRGLDRRGPRGFMALGLSKEGRAESYDR